MSQDDMTVEAKLLRDQFEEKKTKLTESLDRTIELTKSALNTFVTQLTERYESAISAAEELASLGSLDLLSKGLVYRTEVTIEEPIHRRYAAEKTRGAIQIVDIPIGTYKALVVLLPPNPTSKEAK